MNSFVFSFDGNDITVLSREYVEVDEIVMITPCPECRDGSWRSFCARCGGIGKLGYKWTNVGKVEDE